MDQFKRRVADVAAAALGIDPVEAFGLLERPRDPTMGDLALPCFVLAKRERKSPVNLAKAAAERLGATPLPAPLRQVRAVGPYLNFALDPAVVASSVVAEVLAAGDAYGTSRLGEGKTIVVDFSSPNIAKPFGIHHLRSTVIGAALCRLLRAQGHRVVGINHLGDWGTQFGQLLVAYRRKGDDARLEREGIAYLLELYVGFNKDRETEPALQDEARAAFRDLEQGDPAARALWQRFRDVSEAEFRRVYDLLGIRFDHFTGESFYEERMAPVVAELEAKGLLVRSKDASVVDLSEEGLGVAVIKKADDASLYATRDLAAAIYRHETFGFHKALYVVGAAQSLHFRQLVRILEKLAKPFAKDVIHVPFGLLRFKDRKMSTRKGDVVLLEEVLDRAVALAKDVVREKNPELAGDDDVGRAVGVGAVVFNDLKSGRTHDVVFDWDVVLSFEGDTGPYLQYTHARIASILRKAGAGADAAAGPFAADRLATPFEQELIGTLARFPGAVRRAAEEFEPSVVSAYLLDVAGAFNRFYGACPVIGDDPALMQARLALARAVRIVLHNGLALLGIDAPERM